ncbi:MAG: hypothetical protein J6Z25_01705 [Opitutales bacterium]|nr:hypothetical protein [Opitutales bacterium]
MKFLELIMDPQWYMVIMTGLMAFAAWSQCRADRRSVKIMEAAYRAHVVVKCEFHGKYDISIQVHNVGKTPATDVQINIPDEWKEFFKDVRYGVPPYPTVLDNVERYNSLKTLGPGEWWPYIMLHNYENHPHLVEEFLEKGYFRLPIGLSYKSGDKEIRKKMLVDGYKFMERMFQEIEKEKAASQANPPK